MQLSDEEKATLAEAKENQEKEMYELWKAEGIAKCVIEFSCGGDSMNDLVVYCYNEDESQVECKPLETYFNDQVYENVEFYVNSDGHYQGESGSVTITWDEDDDCFTYEKESESEWSESEMVSIPVKLTKKELAYMKAYISNFNGETNGSPAVNYSRDFIITDELQEIEDSITEKLENTIEGHDFTPTEGMLDDWYTYSTNEDTDEPIKYKRYSFIVNVEYRVTVYKSEEE